MWPCKIFKLQSRPVNGGAWPSAEREREREDGALWTWARVAGDDYAGVALRTLLYICMCVYKTREREGERAANRRRGGK